MVLPRLTVLPSSSRVPGFCTRGSASRQYNSASRPCIKAVIQHSTLRQVQKLTGSPLPLVCTVPGALSHAPNAQPCCLCPLRPHLPSRVPSFPPVLYTATISSHPKRGLHLLPSRTITAPRCNRWQEHFLSCCSAPARRKASGGHTVWAAAALESPTWPPYWRDHLC